MAKLKSPYLAVDGVVFHKDKVLLIKRSIEPFEGYWVLPGGHVEYGQKVEKALRREMKEELGIEVKIRKLIGVYSDPQRDPRYHMVSLAYLCQKVEGPIRLGREASRYKYFPLDKLPSKIGFDHRKIIDDFEQSLNG